MRQTVSRDIKDSIGNKKCCELLGYSSKTSMKSRPAFKRYLLSKGIADIKNAVDVVATTGANGLFNGVLVGEIQYVDGRVEKITYKDTGVNDVEYIKRSDGFFRKGQIPKWKIRCIESQNK